MRIGIGLPAAVPGTPGAAVGQWAAEAERLGFQSVGVIDRLVYENLDPLVALGAAAARTERIELMTTVLNVAWRGNPVLLAKQLASVDNLSEGRLTAGLGMGGWPADYDASGVPQTGKGATFDAALDAMRRVWAGELTSADGRPRLLIGGLVPASFRRVAALGEGWVAPAFGFETLTDGIASAQQAWSDAGRLGQPRVATIRYFSLGDRADEIAGEYLAHYYGREWVELARADTLTTHERLRAELDRLEEAGCDDVVLLPCAGDLDQVELLAEALEMNASMPSSSR